MTFGLFSCSKDSLHPSPSGKSLCHVQANVLNLVVQLFPPAVPGAIVLGCHQPVPCRARVTAECPSARLAPAEPWPCRGELFQEGAARRCPGSVCVCVLAVPWGGDRRDRPCAVLSISGCRGTVCPVSHCPSPAHPQVVFPGVPQGCQRGWSVRRREGSQSPSQLLTALKNPGNVSFRHLKAVIFFSPKIETKESL